MPSAIVERQMLPRHTNSTLISEVEVILCYSFCSRGGAVGKFWTAVAMGRSQFQHLGLRVRNASSRPGRKRERPQHINFLCIKLGSSDISPRFL
jgi:hypothetical protein